jgi:hypothetical protein
VAAPDLVLRIDAGDVHEAQKLPLDALTMPDVWRWIACIRAVL